MPKYSGFDPIESHNVVTTSGTTSNINHDSDPVSLYLPFDSDVQDTSANNHTVTSVASATISSTQSKFGGNSLSLNGTSQYLTIPDDDDFKFTGNDFTVEMWVYPTTLQQCGLYSQWGSGSNRSFKITMTGSGNVAVNGSRDGSTGSHLSITSSGTLSVNNWYHIAAVCVDGTVTLYIDGVADGSDGIGGNLYNSTNDVAIGANIAGVASNLFAGYIDDVRVINGVARYIKNFVPPSQAVGATLNGTNETNTTTDFVALYLPFTDDLNDDSSHSHVITASGNATISSTQSKFGTNAAYFDGSGDYLSITSDESELNIGTDDFTFEAYIWLNDLSGFQTIFMTKDGTTNVGHYYLRTNGSKLQLQLGSISNSTLLQLNSTTDLVAQEWTHVAATRTGSSVRLFINGTEAGSGTDQQGTRSLVSSNFMIGQGQHGSPFHGYINDLRILKGYVKYAGDFVPHTSPIGTSVSETVNDLTVLYLPFDGDVTTTGTSQSGNTVLLLNGETDHGGNFYDDKSTYNQSSITVSGSPSPSRTTSSYKFGDASINFDNAGSIEIQSTDFAFGTGDFTIETWAADDNDPDGDLFSLRQSGGGNKIGIVIGSGQFRFKSNDHTDVTELGSSGTTFKHHALVRYNGNISYYINGSRVMYNSSVSAVNYTGSPIISLGGNQLQGYYDGRLDDFRVSNKAVYTGASFSTPTGQFDYSYDTTQGGFEDLARNHSVTKNNDARLNTSVKKFGTSSAYFDGTSDYLSIPAGSFPFGDEDFTIEAWVYNTEGSSDKTLLDFRSGTNDGFEILVAGSPNKLRYRRVIDDSGNHSPNNLITSAALGINAWKHIAITRSNGTARMFIDGTLENSASDTAPYGNNSGAPGLAIGAKSDGTMGFPGYVDDLRVIIGHAKYTANFTAPTSAVGTEVSESSTTITTDTKSLSSTWTMTNDGSSPRSFIDMRSDNTWANNEHLQSQPGHRWYGGAGGGGGGTSVTFKVWGAGGGGGWWNGGSSGSGGSGGFAKGTLPAATPGTTYNVVVGPAGENAGSAVPSTTGGGGAGPSNGSHRAGSGGGYSGVFEGPVSRTNSIIVAGGGGGAGSYDRSGEDESGGGGGGTTGLDAANPGPAIGKGGTQSSGGYGYAGGGTGDSLQGGDGRNRFSMGGGGGGGGYFGGSGGGADGSDGNEEISGGGGGSGYVSPALSDTANLQGVTGTAGSTPGQITAINPTASSDPDYTGSYGKGGGFNSDGNGGYVVITSPSGTTTFTSPGTYTVP